MRIGLLTYDFDPQIGGLGVVAKGYRDALKRLYPEHHIVVLSPSKNADDRVSLLARFFWNRRGGCPLFSFALLWRLNALVSKHRLDVLHVHAGSGGVFLLRKPRIPIVVTAHHTYIQETEYVFANQSLTAWRKRLLAKLEARTYRLADCITAISRGTAESIINDYRIPASKVSVIENGLEESFFQQPELRRCDDCILFVGRLEERKGIWVLLSAFEKFALRVPDVHLRLVGRDMTKGAVAEFIREHALMNRITMTMHVEQSLRIREMQEAMFLVVPSLLEGFGLVAAEGMALGACVLSSDCPGLKALFAEEGTGELFRSGDTDDLARKLEELCENSEERRRLGEGARREAERRFPLDDRARDVMSVLQSVAK